MVARILLFLIVSSSVCLGQALTLADPAFIGLLAGGYQDVVGRLAWWPMNDGNTNVLQNKERPLMMASFQPGMPNPLWVTYGTNVNDRGNSYAVDFNSTGGGINCGKQAEWAITTNSYSLTCWTYREKGTAPPADGQEGIIISRTDGGGDMFRFEVQPYGGYYFKDNGLGNNQIAGPLISDIPTNTWIFWCISRTPTSYTIYTNGVQFGSPASSSGFGPWADTPRIMIGNDPLQRGDIRYFHGAIEEVMIYKNYAINSNDVYNLYHNLYGQP